jgi:hypothetical protein
VIDGALKAPQTQESPFEIGQRLRQEGKGISDLWGAVGSDADMPEAQRGFDSATQLATEDSSAVQPARVPLNIEKIKELQIQAGYKNAPAFDLFNFLNGIRYSEAAHGITKGQL